LKCLGFRGLFKFKKLPIFHRRLNISNFLKY
jgi:hypothetical protein